MLRNTLRCGLAALLLAGLVSAQTQTLTTTFTSNNGQSGNMFDLVAVAGVPIVIQSFDVNIDTGITDLIEVYALTAGGSYIGNEANAGAWTLIGSATVTSAGTDVPTPLNLSLNFVIPGGATQAFYITTTATTSINYTNGTTEGASFANDGFLDFLEGIGVPYAFAGTFRPRVWNGNIHYTLSSLPVAYEANKPEFSFTIDGRGGNGYVAAVSTQTGPASGVYEVNINDAGALSWDLAINALPQVPLGGGALTLPGGAIVNIDLAAFPSFLAGGAAPSYSNPVVSLPGSLPGTMDVTVPYNLGGPFFSTLQGIVINPTVIDGVRLSGATSLDIQ